MSSISSQLNSKSYVYGMLIGASAMTIIIGISVLIQYWIKSRRTSTMKENSDFNNPINDSISGTEMAKRNMPSRSVAARSNYMSVPLERRPEATQMTNITAVNPDMPLALPGYFNLKQSLDFNLGKQIAEGGFSTIHETTLINEGAIARNDKKTLVIAKVPKNIPSLDQQKNEQVFIQEVAIMSDFANSQYFVRLIGYSQFPQIILMKFYRAGNLFDLITMESRLIVDERAWKEQLLGSLVYDIVSGLKEMHVKGIYHMDMKPDNVFLDYDPTKGTVHALIGDFSMSCIDNKEKLTVKAFKKSDFKGLSVPYAPPEVLRDFRDPTDKNQIEAFRYPHGSDIYATAITIYEIILRGAAWAEATDVDYIVDNVLAGKRPELPKSITDQRKKKKTLNILMNMMEEAWKPEANRILMIHLWDMMEKDPDFEKDPSVPS
eukprot:Partr_v1_DN29001_c0_g1_i3_m58838